MRLSTTSILVAARFQKHNRLLFAIGSTVGDMHFKPSRQVAQGNNQYRSLLVILCPVGVSSAPLAVNGNRCICISGSMLRFAKVKLLSAEDLVMLLKLAKVMSRSFVACSKKVPMTMVTNPQASVRIWRVLCDSCSHQCQGTFSTSDTTTRPCWLQSNVEQ